MPHPASFRLPLLLILLLAASCAAATDIGPRELQQDLDALTEAIANGHPDPGHSVSPDDLRRRLQALRGEFRRPLGRDQAWLALAGLNPLLADGHFFIGFSDWRAECRTHLAEGGGLFPFEVGIDPGSGSLYIVAAAGGGVTALRGARIIGINGMDPAQVRDRLLGLVHGDSPLFRGQLLARRWFFYFWKAYGTPPWFEVEVEQDGIRKLHVSPASRALPALLAEEDSFERTYRFELVSGSAAVLTLGSFAWPDPERYYAFTEDAFARMRANGVRTLIVDLRANGGGDDDFWKRGVLRYVANAPYRWGSGYRKRIVEAYRDEGETVGEVVAGRIAARVEPEPDHPSHFDGKLYLLVGPTTYSSAVLFANVVQDFGFGVVAGVGGSVRSRQSGGTQRTRLPNSGLVLYWPRFVLDRPSGDPDSGWLEPDLTIPDNPLAPHEAIEAILTARDAQSIDGAGDDGHSSGVINR